MHKPKVGNVFPEMNCAGLPGVPDCSFVTNHARVLLCIAHKPTRRVPVDLIARRGKCRDR